MGVLDLFSNAIVVSLRVVGSTIAGRNNAVLMGVEGPSGGLDDFEDEEGGESRTDVESWGAPGIVFRPRPEETIDGQVLGAEAKGVRTPEGAIPLAWRDLRWNRMFPAPRPGTIALVGYGGGFVALDDNDDKTTNLTIYVPYDFHDGVPSKAHSVQIGKDSNGKPILEMSSGEGPAFTILGRETVWRNAPGNAFLVLNDDGFVFNGNVRANGAWDVNGATITPIGDVKTQTGVSLMTHLHPTAMGPSGPPTPTPTP